MHRRRLLGLLALPAALALPAPLQAASGWEGHLEIAQRTGLWLTVPSGRAHHIVAWPADSTEFPPPPGWISADRTEVMLKDRGTYRLDWRLTFNPAGGNTRKTASEFWDGVAWRDLGDGNEFMPSRSTEVTLVGWAFCRSDGTNKVRIGAYQDSGQSLKTSDRQYEAMLAVSLWPKAG